MDFNDNNDSEDEDYNEFDGVDLELNQNEEPKATSRGMTTLTKWTGLREISFNDLGQPIGTNQSHFSNYIGAVTKRSVSIKYITWKNVPVDDKDQLWIAIKNYWRIKEDTNKKEVIKLCNTSWKRFKGKLRKNYMLKGREPFEKYSFIEENTWADFVAREDTVEKQQLREKARQNAMKKKDAPHLGPKGYRAMEETWDEEALDENKSTIVHKISNRRARNYLLSRMPLGPDGVRIIPLELENVVQQLLDLDKKLTDGTWEPEPGCDLLTTVVGDEHQGRTRVVGYTTGWRKGLDSYVEKKRKRLSEEEWQAKVERMEEEWQAKVERMEIIMKQMQEQISELLRERNSSCGSGSPTVDWLDEIEGPTQCYILRPYGLHKVRVAIGQVQPSTTLQQIGGEKQIAEGYLSVLVDTVNRKYDYFPLPAPPATNLCMTLGQAKSSFILWPRQYIELYKPSTEKAATSISGNEGTSLRKTRALVPHQTASKINPGVSSEPAKKKQLTDAKKFHNMYHHKVSQYAKKFPCVKQLFEHWMKRENPNAGETFEVDNSIFGEDQHPYFTITPDDIMRLMTNGWLDVSIITWFSMTCHQIQIEISKPKRCTFLNPNIISQDICAKASEKAIDYIKKATTPVHNKYYYILPYFQGFHWTLYIIYPRVKRGYILDSLKGGKSPHSYLLTEIVDKALGRLEWVQALCQQQKGEWECGYYVMKWMHQFVLFDQHKLHEEIPWMTTQPFSAAELENIVSTWISKYLSKP